MAREITVNIVCDGCPEGTPKHAADRIVRIGMGGHWRELDVCATGEKRVRETVGPLMDKGHTYGSKGEKKKAALIGTVSFKDPNRGAAARVALKRNRAIRAYAKQIGIEIATGGPIPQPVIDRYDADHPDAASTAALV